MQRIALGSSYIAYDDVWHRIDVNGRVFALSPTHYRLCHLFLSVDAIVRPTDGIGEMMIISYRSHCDLEAGMELSHRTLVKHVSNLNARLMAMGLLICAFHDGYVLSISLRAQHAQ